MIRSPFAVLSVIRSVTCLLGLGVLLLLVGTTGKLQGQDDAGVTPADAAPAETAAPSGSAAPKSSPKSKSVLDVIADGGVIGVLIILLSVGSVGLMIEHALSIRKEVIMPEEFLDGVEGLIAEGQIDQAIAYCNEPHNESLSSDVVLAGLERFRGSQFGFAEYKAAVEEAGEDQTGRLYRKTEMLGLIGAISPMLGLTGTVLGMIVAFNTIADSGGMAKPDELADGISQALVTTLLGLIVAIPTMVAYSFFRNRIDSLVSEAGKRIERIMMPLGRRR